MIERLQQVLTRIEQLPPEVQEEAAAQLEMLAAIPNTKTNRTRGKGRNLAGAWRDLAWDDEAEAFDRMQHATQPTSPLNYSDPGYDG